jgi:anti-sigma B factor antagonist
VSDFSVDIREDELGRTVVAPRGELDIATHQQFGRAIGEVLSAGQVHIVVDLANTTFMDSTSLGTLISTRRRTHTRGGSFTILCRDQRLLRLFQVTSLDKVFSIEEG